ncbi:serine hydrolase domain-containing protein [Mucilaginibacter antarcticus]|uniref:Serine hydrolase domain-containing protein n=1 Tax=Mucilaginibacter antarcticus TaxID=1855725 RepID=A0ABW5XSE8_9SPHI
MGRFKSLLLVMLLIGSINSWAQPTAAGKLLHQYLLVQQKRLGFNGVVLISKNNRIIYTEVIGRSSVELDVPIKANAVFKIASITKSITAMLVMIAVREGRLKLTDSLVTFFPELKEPSWRNITVDQLLSHRSGIPHNEGIADYMLFKALLPLTKQQALAEIFKTKLVFNPGTSAKYSSPGYFLLAAILEDNYKKSYESILKEKITQPLVMNQTGVANTRLVIPNMVSSYHLLGDSLIVAPYRDFSLMKGSGDMYASAGDLLNWTNSFSGDQWGDIKAQVFAPHSGLPLHNNKDLYGYGWFIHNNAEPTKMAYFHGGGTYGCSALTALYPQKKISIVILSNISTLPVNEIWADIEKIIFNEPFKLPNKTDKVAINAAELNKMAGHYSTDDGKMQLDIMANNKQLYAKLGANPAFEIYPESPLGFYGKKVNIKFTFKQDQEGVITGLLADGRGQNLSFNKIK